MSTSHDAVFDLAIIGGGINGCGLAADAALRGLLVVLCEKNDLASQTSSKSTKLIHGGLRYLEQYEFALVKKALTERQRLLDLAPHLVHSTPVFLPLKKHMRPAWFLRMGLFIYDHLNPYNRLPKSKFMRKKEASPYFMPLADELHRGFLFFDAATDDARLTLVNALLAKNQGASIRTDTEVIRIQRKNKHWQLTLLPKVGPSYTLSAKAIINAAGPWVESINQMLQIPSLQMSLIKGSHIIVPKLYEGSQAYLLQHQDRRVIFVIPYHHFTLIGTTDVAFQGALEEVTINEVETEYLISLVNAYFKRSLNKNDVLHTWSGIRPLLAQKHKEIRSLSRDYYFELKSEPLPWVTIYSGKITTYRQMSEEVLDKLAPFFPTIRPCKTKETPLPGASLGALNFAQYIHYAKNKYDWLCPRLLNRYLYTYGTLTESFLSPCSNLESMGKKFGDSLYQIEVDYLIKEEFAKSTEDILKRRTKLYLEMDASSQEELKHYLNEHVGVFQTT